MNVLYLSYDGMTDPLGQSQVIPYLAGLSNAGYKITIFSFEKKERYKKQGDFIVKLLNKNGIEWKPLKYSKNPPVLSTIWDIFKLKWEVKKQLKTKKYTIIHCRSYITSLVGYEVKKKFGIKFVFDMRGFWADERVEGNLWNQEYYIFRIIFRYFKKKEIDFLKIADQVISLTENAAVEIDSWKLKGSEKVPIQVIPCCADLDHFSPKNIDFKARANWQKELNLNEDDFILGYLGAIGTWYMLDEMLDFFKCLLERKPNAKFLFVTQESPEMIREILNKKEIPEKNVAITHAYRNDLPSLLSLISIALFFIRPSFSKRASSPTKQGELMGMGIPIICNSGIGDTDKIIENSVAGYIIKNFNTMAYQVALSKLDDLVALNKETIMNGAQNFYSLKTGIDLYKNIYNRLLDDK